MAGGVGQFEMQRPATSIRDSWRDLRGGDGFASWGASWFVLVVLGDFCAVVELSVQRTEDR